MCEYQARLVAWLDQELAQEEAGQVEAHLAGCTECRGRVASYKQVGGMLDAYCDALVSASARNEWGSWMPKWVGAAALTAAALAVSLLIFFLSSARTSSPRVVKPAPAPATAAIVRPAWSQVAAVAPPEATTPTPLKKAHRQHAVNPALSSITQTQNHNADWLDEPDVRIAIPADAMFPPGAVPDGISFIADVSIAADGSARRLRLEPQLARYERRPNRP